MRNHPIKIFILLGTLIFICANAGFSPHIMHASANLSNSNMASIPANSSPASPAYSANPGSTFSIRNLADAQDLPMKVLSPTQPLGSLVAITWNQLDYPEKQGEISELLIFPTHEVPRVIVDAIAENIQTIASPADEYILPHETNLVASLFMSKSHGTEAIYCTACHGSPNIGALTKITHIDERLIVQQGDPASIVECDSCHLQNPQHTLWHIRGVE